VCFYFSSRQNLYSVIKISKGEDFLSSSGVERSAVNRFVVGSNPTWGDFLYLLRKYLHHLTLARYNYNQAIKF
jgi:hypothetical protein